MGKIKAPVYTRQNTNLKNINFQYKHITVYMLLMLVVADPNAAHV